MAKKNLDWANIGFSYMVADKRYVSNYKDGKWDEGVITSDNTIVLADEISPDTCRFWDVDTHEKLDKDRFRRDLGNEEHAYQEMLKRIIGE